MKKVIEYDYVRMAQVDGRLQHGWQPWGSPYVVDDETILQAMVRYEEEKYVTEEEIIGNWK